MTTDEFNEKLSRIMAQKKQYGINIVISDMHDKDHLDCVWYGGEVGYIEYRGYKVLIEARGDIRLEGRLPNGKTVYIKDKRNGGSVYGEIGHIIDDAEYKRLLANSTEAPEYLAYENNNWFEYNIQTPSGMVIDMCWADNVIDDDLLDNFTEVSFYLDRVDELILSEADAVWEELKNVPIDSETKCLKTAWRDFPENTPEDEVRRWFESTFNVTVPSSIDGKPESTYKRKDGENT